MIKCKFLLNNSKKIQDQKTFLILCIMEEKNAVFLPGGDEERDCKLCVPVCLLAGAYCDAMHFFLHSALLSRGTSQRYLWALMEPCSAFCLLRGFTRCHAIRAHALR